MSYDLWSMETGDLLRTHTAEQCAGGYCSLHNPSQHPLHQAVMKWDRRRNLMVRFCDHGIWHPDPDDIAFKHRSTSAAWASKCEIHKCDGCCTSYALALQALDKPPSLLEKAKWAWLALVAWVRSFIPW